MYGQRNYGFSLNFSVTPMVKRLMIANVVAFAITVLLGERMMFDLFALQPSRILVRPWGLVSYMFLHAGFMHLAMNMLVLFFFGPPLEGQWGEKEFLRFYFVAGLGGAALSFFFPGGMIVGASGAIYGIMLAFAMNWPNAPIYVWGVFPVKAKWLVGFMFLVTAMSSFDPVSGGTAHLAHMGGLVAAFIYLKADWRPGAAFRGVRTAGTGNPPREKARRRMAIVPSEERTQTAEARGQNPGTKWENVDERRMLDEVDRVLDKISAKGMAALTTDERALLDEVSRRRRSN